MALVHIISNTISHEPVLDRTLDDILNTTTRIKHIQPLKVDYSATCKYIENALNFCQPMAYGLPNTSTLDFSQAGKSLSGYALLRNPKHKIEGMLYSIIEFNSNNTQNSSSWNHYANILVKLNGNTAVIPEPQDGSMINLHIKIKERQYVDNLILDVVQKDNVMRPAQSLFYLQA